MDRERRQGEDGFEDLELFAAFEKDAVFDREPDPSGEQPPARRAAPSAESEISEQDFEDLAQCEEEPRDKADTAPDSDEPLADDEDKPDKKSGLAQGIWSWVKTLLVAFVLAICINSFIVVNAAVQSGSMENTIMTGDRVMCNRLAYVVGEPSRYDIVVFNFEEYGEVSKYVKRVIGLPGETVEIVDGKVYINGSDTPLRDEFVNEVPEGSYGPFEVPQGSYFMLGDNRNRSYDSKSWDDPYIPKSEILGKAMFCYYPSFYTVRGLEDDAA